MVPFGRNEKFVGRESQLEEVLTSLNRDDSERCGRVAISGLGGIGKTQVALEAAFRIHHQFPDCSVFWVPAIDIASFERAYRDIGQELEIPGLADEKADVKELVKTALSQGSIGRWLLIIDNADDLQMLFSRSNSGTALMDYLPFNSKGSILLTTRNNKVAIKFSETELTTLREMSEDDSRKLLERSLTNRRLMQDSEAVGKLLNLLSHLPLAIKQTAAFINENTSSISEYVNIYEASNDNEIELLSEGFEDQGRYRVIQNPIASTWLISFKQIQQTDELAAEFLSFMSLIANQNIPRSLLPPAPDLKAMRALGTLKAYGFLTERNGEQFYDMHRLVHLVVRNWLEISNRLDVWRDRTLTRLVDVFPWPKHENRDECALLYPHTQYILNAQERFPEASGESFWQLLHYTGTCQSQTSNYRSAERTLRRAMDLSEKLFGSEDVDTTAASRNNLSVLLFNQGKYEDAETMQRQIFEGYKSLLGAEHPKTLWVMLNLSLSLRSGGKLEEARALAQQALESSKKVRGTENPLTITLISNLAMSLEELGKFKEAEILNEQALGLREKLLGLEHPRTLQSRASLARCFIRQAKHLEAESILQALIKSSEKVLGLEHPITLARWNDLAVSYDGQRKFAEAETIYRKIWKLDEKLLGPEHPSTMTYVYNLAVTVRRQGKYEEAETLGRHALEVRMKILGIDHPEVMDSKWGLADALLGLGLYEESLALFKEASEGFERSLGPEHPDTKDCQHNYAYWRRKLAEPSQNTPENMDGGENTEDGKRKVAQMLLIEEENRGIQEGTYELHYPTGSSSQKRIEQGIANKKKDRQPGSSKASALRPKAQWLPISLGNPRYKTMEGVSAESLTTSSLEQLRSFPQHTYSLPAGMHNIS